jgi:hypothetical protein
MAILFLLGALYIINQCSYFTKRITLEPSANTLGCLLEREEKEQMMSAHACVCEEKKENG